MRVTNILSKKAEPIQNVKIPMSSAFLLHRIILPKPRRKKFSHPLVLVFLHLIYGILDGEAGI